MTNDIGKASGTVAAPNLDAAVYVAATGELQLDVRVDGETVWLTQAQIAELFGVTRQNINQHLLTIYEQREINRDSTCKDFLQVRREGRRSVKRKVEHYSLDAIISVGYRVNSKTATALLA